jgi:hypothetical protein
MIVYDVATALATTAETDIVTVVPRRFAKAYASSVPIRIVDFPRGCAEMSKREADTLASELE